MHSGDRTGEKLEVIEVRGSKNCETEILWDIHIDSETSENDGKAGVAEESMIQLSFNVWR